MRTVIVICIEDIEKQVAQVIEYSQGLPKAEPRALLDKWYKAKEQYIQAWGGCIYEVPEPVVFYLSTEEKRQRFNEFIDAIDSTYDNRELTEFLDWLEISEVFDNHTTRKFYLNNEEYIPEGTKVSKAFKHFESDETVLRKIQDQLSMIIQEDKICGTLCLSVHPLDYLSVSENTYHWRSCHALDGDYRSGNLQYMVDKSTIVCYLRGAQGQKLPNFPEEVLWNSKKWRMLLFLSDNQQVMFAGRQYPFFSPSAMDCVQEAFLTSMDKKVRCWTPWYNDYLRTFPREDGSLENDSRLMYKYISIRGEVVPIRRLIVEPPSTLFFNDLLESSCYTPYYSWNRYSGAEDYSFHIGDEAPCPCCNGRKTLSYSEDMRCDFCFDELDSNLRDYTYCDCCDRRVIRDEMRYISGPGFYICEECYEQHASLCDKCGESWYVSDLKYDRDAGKFFCPWCRPKSPPVEISFDDSEWEELLPF